MSIQSASPARFTFSTRPITVTTSSALLSSDAGLLPIRQLGAQLGFSQQLADALDAPRDPALIQHTIPAMLRARLDGILAGYEDQNDHDALRTDPVFKLIAGRLPTEADLASQPTLSHFENSLSIQSLKQRRDVFIDQFIASFQSPPQHLLFDLDAVDDPAHGRQQLVLFPGYYEQSQYFPLVITWATNDLIVMVSRRHGPGRVGRLSSSWPYREDYEQVSRAVLGVT